MGSCIYESIRPADLGLPEDFDVARLGYGDDREDCLWYEVYLPDSIANLRPLGQHALDASAKATEVLRRASAIADASDTSHAVRRLSLYAEAVSTVRLEHYGASCESLLDYLAVARTRERVAVSVNEATALAALDALESFVIDSGQTLTLDKLCAANRAFARTSPRAQLCGMLRDHRVYIGANLLDARFVPPPADRLEGLVEDLLKYVNATVDMATDLNPVARAAVAQVQLVTIHPFSDGNGRVCRALSQWVLERAGVTRGVIFPLSAAMLIRHPGYIDALERSRSGTGPADQSPFVDYFSWCCWAAARRTVHMEVRVSKVLSSWSACLQAPDDLTQRAMEAFTATPVMTEASLSLELHAPSQPILKTLCSAGILTRRKSDFCATDVYVATDIMQILTDVQTMRGMPYQAFHAPL